MGEGARSTAATMEIQQAVGTDASTEPAGPLRAEKSFVHKALPT